MNILVVDDNDEGRRLMSRMLAFAPALTVTYCVNGEEALAQAAVTPFDIILLDISLPDIDGTQVCRRVRAGGPNAATRIVACTAHASAREAEHFIASGFSGLLIKPFLVNELFAALGVQLPPEFSD